MLQDRQLSQLGVWIRFRLPIRKLYEASVASHVLFRDHPNP
jgi:hypothetical protein